MTHEVDRWDAEEWLQEHKDIWNHPMVTDRTETNGYEVADLMADFANYILSKQEQKPKDMKQTAVEWLIDEIEIHYIINNGILDPTVVIELKRQAKKMEKEQIINTWTEATAPDHEIGLSDAPYIISQVQKAEQYYNDTYGGNK